MFDKELVLGSLTSIQSALELMMARMEVVNSVDDFLCSPEGMLRLDAVCMNLIALGETVKGLDKLTNGKLLSNYPEVYWSGVMRMRDKIAHHYFEIDTDVVFQTLQQDIPQMLPVVKQMIADVEKIK